MNCSVLVNLPAQVNFCGLDWSDASDYGDSSGGDVKLPVVQPGNVRVAICLDWKLKWIVVVCFLDSLSLVCWRAWNFAGCALTLTSWESAAQRSRGRAEIVEASRKWPILAYVCLWVGASSLRRRGRPGPAGREERRTFSHWLRYSCTTLLTRSIRSSSHEILRSMVSQWMRSWSFSIVFRQRARRKPYPGRPCLPLWFGTRLLCSLR